ncbi:hypothetical protein CP533_1458 [Ophiocordyceps camponoti-saundersi (nom. inval.)]|nr:hypothetical protein CP533_1458 [Ophiocordyceps camponoti-saundersi (nom. inval.)]
MKLLPSLTIWLLLLQTGTSALNDDIDINAPLLHILLDQWTAEKLFLTIYGPESAPSRIRSLGGIWSESFHALTRRRQPAKEPCLREQPHSNKLLAGEGTWIYVVSGSPNMLDQVDDKHRRFNRPVGGIPWSQIYGYAYLPRDDFGLMDWLRGSRSGEEEFPFETVASRFVRNTEWDPRWDQFGLAMHFLLAEPFLRSMSGRVRLLDSVTSVGGLRVVTPQETLQALPENLMVQLRELLHWDPDDMFRKMPLLDPPQARSLHQHHQRKG